MTLSPKTTAGPIPDLQVRFFGAPVIRVQGASLPALHSKKGLWLFALLVLKWERPVDRNWLASTLWPDSQHRESLKNLRNTLSDLRRALGTHENRIESPTSSTLRLDLTGADADVPVFDALLAKGGRECLSRAVELYHGPLLEGCDEEWVVLEREQRQQACLDALEALAHIDLDAGDPALSARRLRTCLGVDPFRETAQCALMSALAASGDYAGVTHVYREFRLTLHEQLHAQPAGETTALYQKIRVRARQVAAGAAVSPPAPNRREGSPRVRTVVGVDGAASDENDDTSHHTEPVHNLPPALTSFVGREKELDEVEVLLARTRLLTLTGAGGSGKTRLSAEAARVMAAAYVDGAWFVELAPISDPLLVVQAVAALFKIREQPGVSVMETLLAALRPKTLLLLLDNCEHLIEACSELAAAILRGCPSVTLLATSRERLNISGEQTYRVPLLSIPNPTAQVSVDSLHRYESVRLFTARACLNRPDFRMTPQNAPSVAQVCRRLDGLPLAIELAAARVRSLSVEDLQRRLDDRFSVLTGGDRSALPRQQTLRALFDWSYDLLNDQEKRLLQRVSVFAGGWTLEAADAVGGNREEGRGKSGNTPIASVQPATDGTPHRYQDSANSEVIDTLPSSLFPLPSYDVLDLLTSLIDKSLVIAEESDNSARYSMLETVRQYSWDRLSETGDSEECRARHCEYYLSLAEDAEPKLQGADQARWFALLESEHENLRAALDWSLEETKAGLGEGETGRRKDTGQRICHYHLPSTIYHLRPNALRLCGALSRFWWTRGHLVEGLAWCTRSLRAPGADVRSGERAKALNGAGVLAWLLGNYSSARAYHEESLAIRKDLGDSAGIAVSLTGLGNVANYQGDHVSATAYYDESLATRRAIGDRSGIAQSLHNLGSVASLQGDYIHARAYYDESLAIYREIGDLSGAAYSLNNLGDVACSQYDFTAAILYHEESLAMRRQLQDRGGIAMSLNNLGIVRYSQHENTAARQCHQECLAVRREIGDRRGIASSLNNIAYTALNQGDYALARSCHEESLAIRKEVGDKSGIAQSLHNLGSVASAQGDYATARSHHEVSLAIYREIGNRGGIAESLQSFAGLAANANDLKLAAALWGATAALREEIGSNMQAVLKDSYEREVTAARQALGDDPFTAEWAKGRAMTLDEAIALALAGPGA